MQTWDLDNPDTVHGPTGPARKHGLSEDSIRGHVAGLGLKNEDELGRKADESLWRTRINTALESVSGCRSLCWTISRRTGLCSRRCGGGRLAVCGFGVIR